MGPIRSFIDTLAERQPVRNAIRTALGMPRRYGDVIDPMEEMTARDRERGQDISREGLPSRRLASTAPMAVQPEGVAMPIPEGPTAPMRPRGAPDPLLPFKGMSLAQASITAPSDALRRYDGMPPRQRTSQPAGQGSDFAAAIRAIGGNTSIPIGDRYAQMGDAAMLAAANPAESKERRAALMRIGENYMKMSDRFYQREWTESRRDKELKDAADYQKQMMTATTQNALDAVAGEAELPQQMLRKNPDMPISQYASQQAAATSQALTASKQPQDKIAIEGAQQRAIDDAIGTRMVQYADAMKKGGPLFNEDHPGFGELQAIYKDILGPTPTPEDYDKQRVRLTLQIYKPLHSALMEMGYSPDSINDAIEGLTGSILGPRPKQTSIFDYLPSFSTESLTRGGY